MSGSNGIIVHAMIINKIIREQHQKRENRTAPLIRANLHPHNKNAIKLINFLEAQREKYGHASSCASDFTKTPTLSNISKEYLFDGNLLDDRHDTEKTNLAIENIYQTQYRRYLAVITHALDHHVYSMPATTGDHVPIILYEKNDIFYLYIALLNVQDDITIDENTGEILDTTSLNSNTFKIALKVDLNGMYGHYIKLKEQEKNANDDELESDAIEGTIIDLPNYVWWVQKGKEQIPQYVQNFIPVKYKIDDAKTTKHLMLTLRGYLGTSPFANNDRDVIDKLVYNLLTDKAEQKLPVNITTDIDPIINGIAAQREIDLSSNLFKDYRIENGFKDDEVGNIFFPDRTTVKGLGQLKFDIKVEGSEPIKISGMRSHAGNTIELNEEDPDSPYVKIKVELSDVPALRQQLNQGAIDEPEKSED
ncbi:nucleoid-associated protein [Acinetobacter junii]|uniref:nucleoid-associated protein n=1 Tax=Acinetobacter junii TaxID=40215 RepID=UPI00124F03C8|nr:nucleoid-associated protein [Acinetobacter junii]